MEKTVISKVICCIVLSLIIVTYCEAQTGTKLRYAFAAGQKISIRQTETSMDSHENFMDGSKSNTSSSREIDQSWVVKSVSPAGDATIDVRYNSLITRTSPGPGIEIVIDTGKPIKETSPILLKLGDQGAPLIDKLELFRKIFSELFIPRTFQIVVSNTGDVKSVSGFDEAMDDYRLKMEKMVPDKAKRAEIDALIEAFFGEDAVSKTFSYTLFTRLPADNTNVGGQWNDSTEFVVNAIHLPIKRSYKLATVAPKGVAFTINETTDFSVPTGTEEVEFKLPAGTIKASITFDSEKLNIQSQDYDGVLEMEAWSKDPSNPAKILHFTSAFQGKVRMTRVP